MNCDFFFWCDKRKQNAVTYICDYPASEMVQELRIELENARAEIEAMRREMEVDQIRRGVSNINIHVNISSPHQ